MLSKGNILGIGDNYLEKCSFTWKPFGSSIKKFKYNFNLIDNTQIDLRCKRTSILIEYEEIDVKRLTLPDTKHYILKGLIKNELSYYYRRIDDIVFKFVIYKKLNDNLDIIVFCLNSNKLRLAERYISKDTSINKVFLIQFCFLKFYSRKIKVENYIFMFQYNNCIYFLCCVNNILIYNSLLKTDEEMNRLDHELHNFIEKIKIYTDASISKIYCANFNSRDFSTDINEEFSIEDLGLVNESKFLKFIKNGR